MKSIGDLASFLFSSRYQSDLKAISERAAQAMATGEATDKARHLGSSTLALSLLERKVTLLHQHEAGVAEAAGFAQAIQVSLGRIQDEVDTFAGATALIPQLETVADLQRYSDQARIAFESVVSTLNAQSSGRHLFSGAATSEPPLPDGASLLSAIGSHVAGAADLDDLAAALDSWFDAPAGGFETTAYVGSSTGFVSMPLGAERAVTFGLRADDPTLRSTLKALALAVFSTDPNLGFSVAEQKRGFSLSRNGLLVVGSDLIAEQGNLGLNQSMIDRVRQHVEDDLALAGMNRLALVGVDQFEEASRFQTTQNQLEMLYRIAARQGATSLAEYLR